MKCTVCGKTIHSVFTCENPDHADYFLMENGDTVCSGDGCLTAYVKVHVTPAQLDQYFTADRIAGGYREMCAASGLDALPPWELDLLADWYATNHSEELVNEEYPADEEVA